MARNLSTSCIDPLCRESRGRRQSIVRAGIRVNLADDSLVVAVQAEIVNRSVGGDCREPRLPAKAVVHGQPARSLPGVLRIKSHEPLPDKDGVGSGLIEQGQFARHEIAQTQAGGDARESKVGRRAHIGVRIRKEERPVSAKGELVGSFDPGHVIAKFVGGRMVPRFDLDSAPDAEPACDRHDQVFRHVIEDVDAHVVGA